MENPILAKMQISESRIRLRFAFLTPPSLSSILNLNTLSEMIWSQHLRMFVLVFALPYQSHSSLDQCSYTHMNIGMGIASGGIGITLTFINCVHRLLSSFDLHTHLWLESCVTWRWSLLLVLLGLLHLRSVESQLDDFGKCLRWKSLNLATFSPVFPPKTLEFSARRC